MYNYSAPPGNYGPPVYGGFPGQSAAPPGVGAPPGMAPIYAAPTGPVLGMPQPHGAQPSFPANFQQPPNMPNINFSAPVIHLGTAGPGKSETPYGAAGGNRDGNIDSTSNRRGQGLGFEGRGGDQGRQPMRDNIVSLQPPTREEIARTIFVGNITEGCGGDEGMQRILGVVGGLRRWTRATDADNKPCTFGFAEYEDADSLGTAAEVFQDIKVPINRPAVDTVMGGEDVDSEQATLLVVVDENSQNYIEEWRSRGSLKDPAEAQFRLDTAKEELEGILASLKRRTTSGNENGTTDRNGDMGMHDGAVMKHEGVDGEIVTIPITVEDELADIPAEMRETVAKEIASFRDRSTRRDLERLRREEEMEQEERRRNGATNINRLASPPPTAPGARAGTSNAIPVGPRDRSIQGAPLGPKGFQGVQVPQDYRQGVNFVSTNGTNMEEDEDNEASDGELETRRKQKREAELEEIYLRQERQWVNRERIRDAANERQKQRDRDEAAKAEATKQQVATRLREWNDDEEASRKTEEYYVDRSQWLRNRAAFRLQEAQDDARDRAAEERENGVVPGRRDRDIDMADQFLAEQAEEMEARGFGREAPTRFKMSLGAAAQKSQGGAAPRRTIAEIEGLLEDEEDEGGAATKRALVPLRLDAVPIGPGMSDEDRAQAVRQLAGEIPTDKEGLWKWNVKWEFVDEAVITDELRPFVEKKILEFLGVQEQMLVDVVENCVRKRGKPADLVAELEGPLEDEAEVLVKKLWRMLIFFSESEKRGLSS